MRAFAIPFAIWAGLFSMPSLDAHADDPCTPSNYAIRVQAPGVELKNISLLWEGASDCELKGEQIQALISQNAIVFKIPEAEFSDDDPSGLLTANVSGSDKSQSVNVQIIKTAPPFFPKIAFYFDFLSYNQNSIADMDADLSNGQKIYKTFFNARNLMARDDNYNIKLASTYFYYQSSILIEGSEIFSNRAIHISSEARLKMIEAIKILEDEKHAEHDAFKNAFKNVGHLIRNLDDIKRELGLLPKVANN